MTTTQESFIRSVIRITIIQILRSIGYTKSSNTLVDILSDVYVRYFELLVTTTKRAQQLRNEVERDENAVIVQDIQHAVDELALVRPSNMLDLYDIDPVNDQYCDALENWCFGVIPDRARDMSKPNLKYIRQRKIEELQTKLNRVGLGGLINSNTYSFSSKTKEEIELERLLNDEIVLNAPDDYLQYLLTNGDPVMKQKLKNTFLADELYDAYEEFAGSGAPDGEQDIPEADAETAAATSANPETNTGDAEQQLPKSDTNGKRQPDYIVFGPTPDALKEYLPYNVKYDIPDFDVARYLNAKNENLAKYHSEQEIKFHDEDHQPHDDSDGRGFQLGTW